MTDKPDHDAAADFAGVAVMIEAVAMAIYYATFELYPPPRENPVSRMTQEQAWARTSDEHRRLCRFQAQRAVEAWERQS